MQRPPPFVRRRSAGALCSTPSSSSTSSSIAFTRASTSTSTRVSQPAQPLHSVGSDTRFGPRSPILHDGDKRHYRVEGLIDAGGCARVALATAVGTPSPRLFAIKVYSRTRAGASMMMMMHENERRILQENTRRKSRWLVGSRAAFGDSWNRYLVMDYYPNSLAGVIFSGEYRPARAVIRLWVEELALGMYELRNRRIVHCDLKPSNILLTWDGHIAIADFGISQTPDDKSPFEECVFIDYGGTYAYQAPELLIRHSRAPFTCAVDMWSLGVVIYEMYTGMVLFSPEASGVRNEVWGWDLSAIVHRDMDEEVAQDLVTGLLDVEPEDRLKVTDLAWHPYFAETNWAAVGERECVEVTLPRSELSSSSWEDVFMFDEPEEGVKHAQQSL